MNWLPRLFGRKPKTASETEDAVTPPSAYMCGLSRARRKGRRVGPRRVRGIHAAEGMHR